MNDSNIELRVSRVVKASRGKVFAAWTDPQLVQKWFAPGDMTVPIAELDARPDGQYRIQMKNSKDETFTTIGQYQEIVPDEKLVFTWGWEGPEREETLVTIELRDHSDGTEVILTHQRFSTQAAADHHQEGWVGCLENLATRIDTF